MRLGKLPAKYDPKNIKFRAILPRKLPPAPAEWDVDFNRQDIWPLPLPTFSNLSWGDCVITGRANQTLRFEKYEQGLPLPISDDDVLREYWKEQGDPTGTKKPDEGLYILDSLKCWRSGWQAAGQEYNIYAFAQINQEKINEVRLGVYLLTGLMTGVNLPLTAQTQLDSKQIWTVETGPNARPGTWGGHCMYLLGYTATGPVFLTWGQRQVATWDWWLKYTDECYGVVDNKDKFLGDKSPVDTDALDAILKQVTS